MTFLSAITTNITRYYKKLFSFEDHWANV